MNPIAWIWLKVKNMMGPTLAAAQGRLQGWGSKVGAEFNKVAARTFGVSQAFNFVKGSMEESLNRAKQFVNLGKRMGMPAEQVAQLERFSEMAGINIASLGKGMQSLQKNAGQAMSDMTSKQGQVFRSLGMTNEQINVVRQGGPEAFIEVRKAMDAIPSQADRAQLWIALLGERYTELKEFVGMSAAEMEEAMDGQIAMGANTIESVAETQKAWGNMFAELSKSIADFMLVMEPVIGLLRVVLNIVMILIRAWLIYVNVLIKIRQVAIAAGVALLGLVKGIFTGNFDMFKEGLDMGKRNLEEFAEFAVDQGKGVMRDIEGMKAGVGQIVGERNSVKMPKKPVLEPLKQDRRTLNDVYEYELALKNQEELDRKREDSLLVDQAKIDNQKEMLRLDERHEALMEQKYGVEYKKTKDYLEYMNKRLDKLKEIEKLEYDLAQARYDDSVEWIDLANEYYLKEMEQTFKSEAEIKEEKARQAVDKIELMQKELDKMMEDTAHYSEMDISKQQKEIFKLAADTALMIRKPLDNLDYKADSLQSVGGGGNMSIAAVSIAKQQLMQQQESNKWLAILARQTEASGAFKQIADSNRYARQVGGGVRK